MEHPPANKANIKQIVIECFDSYPPNLEEINPPNNNPKVGDVIQTVAKEIKILFSSVIPNTSFS